MMTFRSTDTAKGPPVVSDPVTDASVVAANGLVESGRFEPIATDDALLYAWRAGDRRAGDRLVERHQAALERYHRRRLPHEAADLVQQTLLACVERRDQVPAGVAFRAYLFGIARKVVLLHLRRHEVRRRKAPMLSEPDAASVDPADDMLARERAHRLLREFGQLPIDLQRTTGLFYWGERKLGDISRELGLPMGTVKSRMHAAKRILRERMIASA